MKRTLSLLTLGAALSLIALPAAAETAHTGASASTSVEAQQDTGVFAKISNWFAGNKNADTDAAAQADADAQADVSASTEPAAGTAASAPAPQRASTNRPANAPRAQDTNPVVGRVISEQGAKAGIHSNVQMGAGAGGTVGNE